MAFIATVTLKNSPLSRFVRAGVISLAVAAASLAALADSSDAHRISKGRAMAIASKIAKSEARDIAHYLEQDVGGNWYPSGWANSCKVSSGYVHGHSARCRITAGALSPDHGTARCFATASIRLSGSSVRYSVSGWGGDCS